MVRVMMVFFATGITAAGLPKPEAFTDDGFVSLFNGQALRPVLQCS
jgi:hypothetical protein